MDEPTKKCFLVFLPGGTKVEVAPGTKLLVGARQAGVPIRFMCASLRCGTCGVRVDASRGILNGATEDELAMLRRLKLPLDGTVRMACRSRIESGEVHVDLEFQDSYDPSDSLDFDQV